MPQRHPNRSRLIRHIDKQSRRNLFFSILGIVAIFIFLFKLGIPLLIRFSVFVGDLTQITEINDKKGSQVLLPPRLSPLPTATNSAAIKVEGIGPRDSEIEVFVNGELIDTLKPDEDGNFATDPLKLVTGENVIKTRAKDKENKSDFSQEVSITYDDEPPKLEIGQPSDNQTFGKETTSVSVSGKTEANTRVTINGFWAVVDNIGEFSYTLPLSPGENKITIEAVDEAGNKTTTEKKVILSQ